MSAAFQCDLCKFCEPGEPMVRFKLEATGASHPSEEWCDECLRSYEEWRESRRPVDAPEDAEVPAEAFEPRPFPSVPIQGAYQ